MPQSDRQSVASKTATDIILSFHLRSLVAGGSGRLMKANEYSAALARLPFGKKLPDAVYVYWVEAVLPEPLRSLVVPLRQRLQLDDAFNVIKG